MKYATAALSAFFLCGTAGVVRADQIISLGVVRGQMKYDRDSLETAPGEKITLTLKNTDDLPHNFLLVAPGEKTGLEVAQKAWALGEKGVEKQFLPDDSRILAHTKIVAPRTEETITFNAPQNPGIYNYVCTYPGHAMTMKGVMFVGVSRPGLKEVTWQYFEGSVRSVLDLRKLQPVATGATESGMISLKPRKRDDNFGFIWKGKLGIPAAGTYRFYLDSDDGSGLIIDGKVVVANDGIHAAGTARTNQWKLERGDHDVEILFFEQGNEQSIKLAMQGAGLPLTNLADEPLQMDAVAEGEMDIAVAAEPRIFRVLVPGGGTRCVSVGLPGGINYTFDTEQCSVINAWSGGFLNVAGDRTGRGGNQCRILGQQFNVGGKPAPLRFGSVEAQPAVKFLGYRRAAAPQMFYKSGEAEITQTIRPLESLQPGLRLEFEIKKAPAAPVFFVLNPAGLDVSSPDGEVKDGVVAIHPDKKGKFSITLKAK